MGQLVFPVQNRAKGNSRCLSIQKERDELVYESIEGTTKKKGFLDGFKPSRNQEKPSGKRSRRFFLNGFKPSRTIGRHLQLQTIWEKPSAITDGLGPNRP